MALATTGATTRLGRLTIVFHVALDTHAGEEQDFGTRLPGLLFTRRAWGLGLFGKWQDDAHGGTYQQIAPEIETPFALGSLAGKES
ncbi:hypothetical protein RNI52_02865 [Labrys neptuniae]|uniref:Uncharacterized protein n=1 Tax=Labrys neptuniae TaxID=376174 RepID=A0ABV3PKU6_9HYPH|nr:hypothetical protein [Labrys neptuniae]